ncbi:TPA: hypothetical protein DIC21_00625 [Candidatus Uhrbacteria bacterium]|nr:hypothetical protein [Candidatus Uhrbacteria bacterium]
MEKRNKKSPLGLRAERNSGVPGHSREAGGRRFLEGLGDLGPDEGEVDFLEGRDRFLSALLADGVGTSLDAC